MLDYLLANLNDSLIDEYLNLGKYEEMGTLLARAVPLAEENLKEDSDLKYGLLLKQAVYYSLFTRQMQKAEALYNKMLAMPVGNGEKAISLILIAENCFFADDYSNAINYILKAWDIYEKYLPKKKEIRIAILTVTSHIYLALGNTDEGLKFAQEAYDLSVELFGHDSMLAFNIIPTLAMYYSHMEKYAEAVELWKENYELGIKLNLNNTMNTIMHMFHIANSYYNLDDYESGITWAKQECIKKTRAGKKQFRCTKKSLIDTKPL